MALLAASIAVIPAYAQSNPITILETNKQNFVHGDDIIISGSVRTVTDRTIQLQILSPNNDLVAIAQANVALDGTFVHNFPTGGDQWIAGNGYSVKATYAQTSRDVGFNLRDSTGTSLGDVTDCTSTVDGGSLGNIRISCSITGGTVSSMNVDSANLGLRIFIASNSDGQITLHLPTALIDAKDTNDANIAYIVRIDGVDVPFVETITSATERAIQIDFRRGESNIEVIGTMVVPEFGAVAMFILVAGIIAASVAGRSRLAARF